MIVRKLKAFFSALASQDASHSYAQCGEDLIIDFLFVNYLRIPRPVYLDIGAHHPKLFSNTCYFYRKGSRGVCIEPDPFLCREIVRQRPGDTVLNLGIGDSTAGEADFYIMSTRTLNTFSKPEAERYQSYGMHRIEKVVKIPLVSVNQILRDHFPVQRPNFVSLDVEGLDLQILRDFDFGQCRPEVFCVETLTFSEDKQESKIAEIISFMEGVGYRVYADTYINTIFVEGSAWERCHEQP